MESPAVVVGAAVLAAVLGRADEQRVGVIAVNPASRRAQHAASFVGEVSRAHASVLQWHPR